MALLIPRQGACFKEVNSALVSNAEFGTSVAASSTIHTKGSPVELIAATGFTAFGVIIGLGNVGTAATTNSRTLVDIMIGANGSEQVLIPNLMAGQAGASNSASSNPIYYYFPIIVPAGARLSARSQALISSDTVHVQIHLIQQQIPGRWYGSRVTAYGADEATSTGVSHTPAGSGTAYATTTEITASCANPVKALQVGIDMGTDTTGSNARGVLRITAGSSTNYIVQNLPFRASTTLEFIDPGICNFILSHIPLNIPAGSYLGVGAMMSTAEARGFALYGVD